MAGAANPLQLPGIIIEIMKVLVTGTAGFIGFHLVQKLLQSGHEVVGLDSVNEYYDVNLKYARLRETGIETGMIEPARLVQSSKYKYYRFIKASLEDQASINRLFETEGFDSVVNLAAQAGVRYSLQDPHTYISSNILGFLNILEGCRNHPVKHLVYASSSSVYGLNENFPFSAHGHTDHPVSLYAASKKSNEMMAHAYSSLYGIPTTGLRFFTVYGPWGRPDMALFIFTKAIAEGKPIDLYNFGEMERDFTYVDDIVEGIARVLVNPSSADSSWNPRNPNPATSRVPYRIYNIGNNRSVKLTDFIDQIEIQMGKKAVRNLMPLQPGDVVKTWADVDDLQKDFAYQPVTTVEEGIRKFITWFKDYYKI